jgi:hypothetical protein
MAQGPSVTDGFAPKFSDRRRKIKCIRGLLPALAEFVAGDYAERKKSAK